MKIIDKIPQAMYRGQIVEVMGTRCPKHTENGAFCDIRYPHKYVRKDIPACELSFVDLPSDVAMREPAEPIRLVKQ